MLQLLQEPPGTNQTPRPNAAEHAPPTAALRPCGTAPAAPVLRCPKAASAPEHASKLTMDGFSIIAHHTMPRNAVAVTFHVTTCNFSVEGLVARHGVPAHTFTRCQPRVALSHIMNCSRLWGSAVPSNRAAGATPGSYMMTGHKNITAANAEVEHIRFKSRDVTRQ
jgi:hypothetical protein